MSEHLDKALAAIQALRSASIRGDTEAAAELVTVALRAAGHIRALASHPEGNPGRVAIDTAAAESDSWPIKVGAMQEWRESHKNFNPTIPASLGTALPIKIKGRRDLDYRSRTGFALSIHQEMDKRHLPPLADDTVDAWVDAAMAHLENECQGCFESFPWPKNIREDAKARLGENANEETAFHGVLSAWLKYGFKQLAKS